MPISVRTLSIFRSAMSDIEKKSKEEQMEQALEESRYMLLLNKLLRLRCIYGEKMVRRVSYLMFQSYWTLK